MNKVSPLQLYDGKYWASHVTTENHLEAIGAVKPQLISNMVEYLYPISGPYNPGGEDIYSILSKFPVHYIDDPDVPYQWYLADREDRSIALVSWGDSSLSAITFPGKGFSSFFVKFAEDYFGPQVVIGSDKKETYQLQIMGDPISSDASGAVYEVRLVTGDPNAFIPSTELYTGSRWVEMTAYVENAMGKRAGKLNHAAPFKMENDVSMIRLDTTIPGNMIDKGENAPLVFFWKDPQTGKTNSTWLGKLEWDYLKKFRMYRTNAIYYGKSTKKADGSFSMKGESGWTIRTGFGLYDQVSPTNVHYRDLYDEFDLDEFEDLILAMTVGKFTEDARKIVVSTGTYGAKLINNAIIKKAGGFGAVTTGNNGFVRNNNAITQLGAGKYAFSAGTYTKYTGVLNFELEVIIDPLKDDLVINTMEHPMGGKVNSRIMDIWDFGTDKGTPNIQLVKPKGTMQTGLYRYVAGLRSPYSLPSSWDGMTPTPASNAIDGYQLIRQDQLGVKVNNPMRCARILPNLLKSF